MPSLDVATLGAFIREQREKAQVSVRELAKTAGVSNPYLSQIERGLRRPSAEILQQIAKGLRISAEVLYVRAGILEDRHTDTGVAQAVASDAALSERQKEVLLEIYASFRNENEAGDDEPNTSRSASSSTGEAEPSRVAEATASVAASRGADAR